MEVGKKREGMERWGKRRKKKLRGNDYHVKSDIQVGKFTRNERKKETKQAWKQARKEESKEGRKEEEKKERKKKRKKERKSKSVETER